MPHKKPDASEVDLESLAHEFPDVDFTEVFHELYGRHGHRYHRNLQRKLPVVAKRSQTVPVTSYQTTYGKVHRARPRSTKRPPRTPPVVHAGPTNMETCQRTSYTPKDFSGRGQLVKMTENYQPSTDPFHVSTVYSKEFTGKFSLPEIRRRPASEGHLKKTEAKFDSRTTTKEHYRQWIAQPSITFGELPSFAGSILYPDKTVVPDSTMQSSYPGAVASRVQAAKIAEPNIKLEGDMDMATTTQLTYHKFKDAKPAEKIVHKPGMDKVKSRGKFQGETQTKRDFPKLDREVRNEARPRPSSPPPATIQLAYNQKHEFHTEQRSEFKGHDTRQHPVVKSCKKDDDHYEPPTEKFETMTSQKKDYQPIDIKAAYQPPAKVPQTKSAKDAPRFDSRTTCKDHYKQWVPQPSITFGELPTLAGSILYPENTKVPSSTTKDSFKGTVTAREAMATAATENIRLEGEHDLTTTNMLVYKQPKLKVSRAQAQMIREELSRRRLEKTVVKPDVKQAMAAN